MHICVHQQTPENVPRTPARKESSDNLAFEHTTNVARPGRDRQSLYCIPIYAHVRDRTGYLKARMCYCDKRSIYMTQRETCHKQKTHPLLFVRHHIAFAPQAMRMFMKLEDHYESTDGV